MKLPKIVSFQTLYQDCCQSLATPRNQQEIVDLLNIKQPEVSNLMQGKYHLFSEGRLFEFLSKLNKKIRIEIYNYKAGDSLVDVILKN